MGMPTTIIGDIEKAQAKNNVMASISLENGALLRIGFAGDVELRKIVESDDFILEQKGEAAHSIRDVLLEARNIIDILEEKYAVVSAGTGVLSGETGLVGATGAAGVSAYDIWLTQGNTGTTAQYVASLVGPTGATGPTGLFSATPEMLVKHAVFLLQDDMIIDYPHVMGYELMGSGYSIDPDITDVRVIDSIDVSREWPLKVIKNETGDFYGVYGRNFNPA
jgi:hypothetical protein